MTQSKERCMKDMINEWLWANPESLCFSAPVYRLRGVYYIRNSQSGICSLERGQWMNLRDFLTLLPQTS